MNGKSPMECKRWTYGERTGNMGKGGRRGSRNGGNLIEAVSAVCRPDSESEDGLRSTASTCVDWDPQSDVGRVLVPKRVDGLDAWKRSSAASGGVDRTANHGSSDWQRLVGSGLISRHEGDAQGEGGDEACDDTINPIFGCLNVPGAMLRMAPRVLTGGGETGETLSGMCRLHAALSPERLALLGKGKPRIVFRRLNVRLVEPGVEQDWRTRVFRGWTVWATRCQHQFVLLTKRPERITRGHTLVGAQHLAWGKYHLRRGLVAVGGASESAGAHPQARECGAVAILWHRGGVAERAGCAGWIIVGPQSGPGAVIPDATWQDIDSLRRM